MSGGTFKGHKFSLLMKRVPTYLDFTEGRITEVPSTDSLPASNVQLPIGYVVMNTTNTDPADYLGYGYWVYLGFSLIGLTTVYFYKNSDIP